VEQVFVERVFMDKKLEEQYLEQFIRAYPQFPEGIIDDSERPDFIVRQGDKRIGIEICRLYKDSRDDSLSIQAQEQWKKGLVEDAWKIFLEKSSEKYRVFVSFEERTNIKKDNIGILSNFIAEKILERIRSKKPEEGNPIDLGRYDLMKQREVLDQQHDIVSLIQVYDFKEYGDYSWTQSNVFTVETLNYNNLIKIIKKKDTLIETYQRCEEIWLLIVVDFWNPTMDQDIPRNFNVEMISSKFDRMSLFKTAEEIIKEIQ
jgi:hypothetical protein